MAYATTNPPILVQHQPIAHQRAWLYVSTHTRAVVVASTHITNGADLGMKVGDTIHVGETTAASANAATDIFRLSLHQVRTVSSTFVVLSAGLLLSSAS